MTSVDVVPVEPETVDKWEHPPYSGYYDGIPHVVPLSFRFLLDSLQANTSGAGEASMIRAGSSGYCARLCLLACRDTKDSPKNRASIETLLEKGFKPARTIVLAFGFDEEASGLQVSEIYFNTAWYLGSALLLSGRPTSV